ncbi:hypothetical protein A2797_01160 [candidate division WWE3 bacterium RIFCSPHIGHO2_01_FULL_48_15]|uniref:LytR/CpsA/Psr regulator C-terminal domain-containing protein n=1 Tax=candidate division WWE3 bacterium RIFCSPHIGHO2_01_FULL_48_15 TaxID=1802619 RepID=A0A1F4VFF0_UNCKA|nr:MAG: hypothetical protein A2797_01160 [candidate division WWE3 bacterium RIFCSPHIGHO2_01_FULL_48_15]
MARSMPKRYRSSRARSHSSWRSLRLEYKLKKIFRRVSLALIVVFAVFLTLGAIYIWNFFAEPFASASSTFQKAGSWDGETTFNLLWLQAQDSSVLAFNPTQNSFTVVNLPVESKSVSDSEDGLQAAALEASRLLGTPIDGYVLVGEQGLEDLRQIFPMAREIKDYFSLSSVLRLPGVWQVAREHFQTSLDFAEIFRVLWYLAQVRSDKIDLVNLSPELLEDTALLDRKLAPFLRDEKLFLEHLRVQVLNGSGKPGLAFQAARLIKNLGGEVIRADNFERQDLIRGYLLLDSSGSYTARRLSQIFGVFDSRPPRTGSESRADITLVLGIENAR